MWKNWDKENEKLKEENIKLKFLLGEAKVVIQELLKEREALKNKPERQLKPTIGLRYTVMTVNTSQNKFGIFTEGTKEVNILQQWYSVDGTRENSDGEWRDVRMEGSLY
jgi:hypothetical protein